MREWENGRMGGVAKGREGVEMYLAAGVFEGVERLRTVKQ
jgi:hypothetical protein